MSSKHPIDKNTQRRAIALVAHSVVGGLALTFANGINILVSNQNTYFLLGYRLADPSFISNDWLTWQTEHHHLAFGYLLSMLLQVGSMPVMVMLAQAVTMVIFALGIWLMCWRLCRFPEIAYWAVVSWLCMSVPNDMGLGMLYLYSYIFQPSQVAGPMFVLGLGCLLNGRLLIAGLSLGIAGLFHAGMLVSFAPAVLAMAAVCLWRAPRRHVAAFLLPLGLFWGLAFLVMLRFKPGSEVPYAMAYNIGIQFRGPHHNVPSVWHPGATTQWLLWAGLAATCLPWLRPSRERKAFLMSSAVCFVVGSATIALAATGRFPGITILNLWRVAPLLFLFLLIALCDALVANRAVYAEKRPWLLALIVLYFTAVSLWLAVEWGDFKEVGRAALFASPILLWRFAVASTWRRLSNWLLALAFAVSLSVVGWGLFRHAFVEGVMPIRLAWTLTFVATSAISARAIFGKVEFPASNRRHVFAIFVSLAIVTAFLGFNYRSHINHDPKGPQGEFEAWIRHNTPEDAIFVVYPSYDAFRLRVRRAIVVDWLSFPYGVENVIEWHERILMVCGLGSEASTEDVDDGFTGLDTARAQKLRALYGAEYVVLEPFRHQGDLLGLELLYYSQHRAVYRIPDIDYTVPPSI